MLPLVLLMGRRGEEDSLAITSLTATATDATTITVAWAFGDTVPSGWHFSVQRGPDALSVVEIDTTAATTYEDTGLTAGTYFYRVQLINASGDPVRTSPVDSATVAGAGEPAPPAPPTDLAYTLDNVTVTLTWTDNAGNEDGYRILRETPPGSGLTVLDTIAANSTTYEDATLVSGESYNFQVQAFNDDGTGESNTVSLTAGVPAKPTGLTVTGRTATSVSLEWTDGGGPTPTGYRLYANSVEVATPAGTSDTVTGLTEGTTYTWTVAAENAAGLSEESDTVPGHTQLATPTNLTPLQIGGDGPTGFVRFSWTDNSGGEDEFVLQKDAVDFRTVGADVTSTDVVNTDADGTFRVIARAAGLPESDPSNEVTGPPWPA